MFLDVTEIRVRSGRGGNGIVAFRHEAHVPKGGPGGGDGGRGGNVYLKVDPHKRTLLDFQYRHVFAAPHGAHGSGSQKTGKSAKPLTILVPPGTMVFDVETGEQVADLTRAGDRLLAARGGRGGRGNAAFATATRQAPRFAEMGERGDEHRLRLELKLIADVGIIGFPNVGKSTLISRISAAKPQIAPYHFTTLQPNLGVVKLDDRRSFVVADVPGLIEGAHLGVGLGHQFLRHVERTSMLIHMVDVAGTEGRDPVQDYEIINRELRLHDERLAQLPQIVALNKMDVLQDPDNLARTTAAVEADGRQAIPISGGTGLVITDLVGCVSALLGDTVPAEEGGEDDRKPRLFEMPIPERRKLDVRRMAPNVYMVRGTDVEEIAARTNLESVDGVEWLHTRLDEMGVLARLEDAGAHTGDTVFIGDVELEYQPG